ncbi:copper amine oxidase N-terminal domain-containing protein [Paenibacillus jiagnxiensis]|uniref:copper amine oxidase N-terminal domain-containing protein n=1 Tax=Paenibacillus jiagnxiensis TaxID=3228926 RepID=UPI0033B24945
MKTTKLLSMFSLIITIMLMTSRMAYASLDYPEIYINNEKLDVLAGIGTAGVTYVPFRPIFEKFNMNVSWDSATKTVTATNGTTTIVLTHNSYYALVNGKEEKLVAPPFLDPTDGFFNVNLRFIAETLGAKVTWVKKGNDAAIYIDAPNISE